MKMSKERKCTQHILSAYFSDTVLYFKDVLYMKRGKGRARRKRSKREGNKGGIV